MNAQVSGVLAGATSGRRYARRALALLWLMAASPTIAGPTGMVTPDTWRPYPTVGVLERVMLRVYWYESVRALRQAASERDIASRDLQGFSILRRNTETGEYFCDVHVVRMGSALVDRDRTVTFGHEALHCLGFGHD